MGVRTGIAAAALLLVACGREPTVDPQRAEARNVLLVVVDSLRADHLGLYGYDRPTSPFLDRFAKDSVVFDDAWAPSSYTSQSVASILTGRLPSSGGATGLMEAEPNERAATLQGELRRRGYRTAVVSSQPLLRRRAFTRDFEDIQVSGLDDAWSAAEVSRRALESIEAFGANPWLVYVHFADPHQPYDAPAEVAARLHPDGRRAVGVAISVPDMQQALERGPVAADDARVVGLVAAYDAEIAAVDAAIEELAGGLEALGLAETTVLAVTASQGEELLDHGWWGHAWTLYEEVLRVPLLLRAPGLAPRRVSALVSLVDLASSLQSVAVGESAASLAVDGEPFLRRDGAAVTLRVAVRPKLAELVIEERCVHRAVRDGDWKYVATTIDCPLEERRAIAADYPDRLRAIADGSLPPPDPWSPPVVERLYDLGSDPLETVDVARHHPDRLAALRRVLVNYQDHVAANGLDAAEALAPAQLADPSQTERLESLGYL